MRALSYLGAEQYRMSCESARDTKELVHFLKSHPRLYQAAHKEHFEVFFMMALDGIPGLQAKFPYQLVR